MPYDNLTDANERVNYLENRMVELKQEIQQSRDTLNYYLALNMERVNKLKKELEKLEST